MTQEIITQISSTVGTEVFGIWFLIGAAFVFFMQAGFAMVETGFTRAKNAGNIIMKNLMDFCIGTIVFIFLGFGLLRNKYNRKETLFFLTWLLIRLLLLSHRIPG